MQFVSHPHKSSTTQQQTSQQQQQTKISHNFLQRINKINEGSNHTTTMNVDTTPSTSNNSSNNGNNMPPTSIKELSELLHSNRKNHQAAMKAARVEFRSSLKELSSATKKQEKRKSFQAESKAKQQSFQESQGTTRKSYFSSLDSEKERMVARSVLKKLMEQQNDNNNKNNGGGDDDCDMTDEVPMKKKAARRVRASKTMRARHSFRASLKDLSPDEKSAKRKTFREEMNSKKQEIRASLKDFRATLKDLSPDEKSAKRKMFRQGMKSKTKEFRAMKQAHQAEMRDARKKFQKLSQEGKGPKRQLFKAEMELKKRVFQTTLWAETRKVLAGNDGLSAEEKDALAKVQELPEFFVTQRTGHEAALEAHREAFQAGLDDGMSDSDEEKKKKKKRKAFHKEIQSKRQAFMADMLAIQQAAFSRLKEAKSMNNACEIMENLCLHDDSTGADAEDDADGAVQKAVDAEDSESKFEAKKVEDSNKSGTRKVVLKKMVTSKNAIRAHACPRKVFRASLQGLSREEKKAKWQEHQAVTQATKDEVRSDIAEFKLSLDGLSDDEKAKKWQTRLEEVHARFVAVTRDGTDAAAIRLAHVEMNQNRRAAKQEGMFKKGMFKKAPHNVEEGAADDKMKAESEPSNKMEDTDEEMDGKAKFEPSEEFKKDLEDFAANLQGLSSQEQKIQWKNRVQDLQNEVRKARMMVAMTRKAQREVLKAGKSGGDAGEDFEMVEAEKEETDPMTGKDDEINLGDEAFGEVHVEGDEAFEEVHVEGEPTKPISETEPVDNGDGDDDFVVCA